ncbi:hypothetical protein PG997_000098 [Apiospora hydei]|uniref:Oxidoreductase acuF-like C2H2 type zinc-finger domain-containing protein n=1 Tax=Apiospora hydei TaxID=1337664 RepID=A0ABR1X9S0_9PEZI
MATLYDRTTTCIGLFADLERHLENGPEEHRKKISVSQVENEAARLRVWAGNLGALRTGHAALDHRLRDSTVIRNAIVRTLDKIEDVLRISCSIVQGDRAPLEDAMGDYGDIDEQDDTTYSDDSDNSKCALIDNELAFNFAETTDLLSELHRLSFRIRNPGARATAESNLKARLHRETDPYTREDIFERYAKEDHLRIKGLIADFHLQSGHKLDHASDYLIERASIANTTRRRVFSYWKAHAARLARVSTKPQVSIPALQPANKSAPHRAMPPLERPAPSVAPTNEVSEPKTATSATEATKFAPNLDVEWDSRSQISYMSTIYDTMGAYCHPPPPQIPSKAKEYTCPYCQLTCPARHFKGQAWRKHVLQDFQPYFCTYKECPEDTALYGDRIAWKEHECLVHRRVWHCFEHPSVFGSQSTVHRHLANDHKELNPSQIQSLLGMAVSEQPDERSKCPFCGMEGPFEADFADHLACHMEKFAMTTSPLGYDRDENPHGSGSSVAISGGANSRLSLSSLSSFDSHIGGAENDVFPSPDIVTDNINAESKLRELMETRKQKLGPDHPDTLASMANLASTYRN